MNVKARVPGFLIKPIQFPVLKKPHPATELYKLIQKQTPKIKPQKHNPKPPTNTPYTEIYDFYFFYYR